MKLVLNNNWWRLLVGCTLFLLLLVSCGPKGDNFVVEGKLEEMDADELYVYTLETGRAKFDTLKVKDGEFSFQGETDTPIPYILVYKNGMEHVIFVSGGKTIKYKATSMTDYEVEGTEENELLNDFRKKIRRMNQSGTQKEAIRFIDAHPSSPVSIYLLDYYFVQVEKKDFKQIDRLAKQLQKCFPNSVYLINIQTKIKSLSGGKVGGKLPDVDLITSLDDTLSLGKLSKPYTLLCFWSTWMDDDKDVLSSLKKQAENHPDSLDVIAISLDNQIFTWEERVKNDSIVHHVCDGDVWDSKSVMQLGVHRLPTYFLADSVGTILDRKDRVDDIQKSIKKYINNTRTAPTQ